MNFATGTRRSRTGVPALAADSSSACMLDTLGVLGGVRDDSRRLAAEAVLCNTRQDIALPAHAPRDNCSTARPVVSGSSCIRPRYSDNKEAERESRLMYAKLRLTSKRFRTPRRAYGQPRQTTKQYCCAGNSPPRHRAWLRRHCSCLQSTTASPNAKKGLQLADVRQSSDLDRYYSLPRRLALAPANAELCLPIQQHSRTSAFQRPLGDTANARLAAGKFGGGWIADQVED